MLQRKILGFFTHFSHFYAEVDYLLSNPKIDLNGKTIKWWWNFQKTSHRHFLACWMMNSIRRSLCFRLNIRIFGKNIFHVLKQSSDFFYFYELYHVSHPELLEFMAFIDPSQCDPSQVSPDSVYTRTFILKSFDRKVLKFWD